MYYRYKKYQMIIFLVVILCFVLTKTQKTSKNQIISDPNSNFSDFKTKFGKRYSNTEQVSARTTNYQNNLAKFNVSNCTACGVTQYFDRSNQELEQMRGLKISNIQNSSHMVDVTQSVQQSERNGNKNLRTSTSNQTTSTSTLATASAAIDWRTSLKVTPVKNQGNCGDCWAFSTVAFFESVLLVSGLVATSNPPDLAEQFALKCDTVSSGCNGGNDVSAANLIISKGLPLESTFPYNSTASYPNICSATPVYTFTGFKLQYYFSKVKMSDRSIIAWLNVRPLMIYVTASTWYMYSPSTTSRTFSCSSSDSTSTSTLNHAVLLVGYTSTEWIIKNSWGTSYGSNGYIYVSRTSSINCGIGFFVATLQ